MNETTVSVESTDGIALQVYRWAPEGEPRAIVQIQHGLAEHAGRYRRLAEALTDAGYLVYAPDARGSGRTANGDYGNWGRDGWPGWVDDVDVLSRHVHAETPGKRLALLGHSMGSFASQQYLLDHSADVDAVILSGTTDAGPLSQTLDSGEPADLSAFNAPFEHRTGYEWLSRDETEVDKYVNDPACGWEAPPFPGIASMQRCSDPGQVEKIRKNVPVLLISGTADPLAGGGAAIEMVGQRYRDAGIEDVTVRLYPEARHELLNETNRDEVTADILSFLDRTVG